MQIRSPYIEHRPGAYQGNAQCATPSILDHPDHVWRPLTRHRDSGTKHGDGSKNNFRPTRGSIGHSYTTARLPRPRGTTNWSNPEKTGPMAFVLALLLTGFLPERDSFLFLLPNKEQDTKFAYGKNSARKPQVSACGQTRSRPRNSTTSVLSISYVMENRELPSFPKMVS